MKVIKTKLLIIPVGLLIVGTLIAFYYPNLGFVEKKSISYIEPIYAADFSDDRVLVGASHNIFIGTVLEQTGTKERGIGPETQYSVQVTENIKGDLTGTITVDQQGGYKDGTLYVVDDDGDQTDDGGSYLLQPGSTYLFATRYNKTEDWYTLNSYPTAHKLLATASTSTLQSAASFEQNPRVQALKAAYPNEIPLAADMANGNALNSYSAKLQAEEAVEVASSSESESTTTEDTITSTSSGPVESDTL